MENRKLWREARIQSSCKARYRNYPFCISTKKHPFGCFFLAQGKREEKKEDWGQIKNRAA